MTGKPEALISAAVSDGSCLSHSGTTFPTAPRMAEPRTDFASDPLLLATMGTTISQITSSVVTTCTIAPTRDSSLNTVRVRIALRNRSPSPEPSA